MSNSKSETAKVVYFYETGAASVLKAVDEPLAEPGAGEVRIKVRAFGLNRAEVLMRQGLYLEKPVFPSRIGYEASGTVDAVGAGVSGFAIGDKVSTIPSFSQSKYGVYGEQALVPASSLVKNPAGLDDVAAASIWMQYFTAYGALVMQGGLGKNLASLGNGNSAKKHTVLVTAASSSVGYAAIQICLKEGATVIATTRIVAKKQSLLDAGAHHVIITGTSSDGPGHQQDLVNEILKITEAKGVDIVFDAIAGPLVLSLAKAAAFEGKIILYGALSLESTVFPLQLAIKKGLSISGYSMMQITEDGERMEIAKQYVLNGLQDGSLKPVIDKVFPFEQLKEAHEYMESNKQQGKIVVRVS